MLFQFWWHMRGGGGRYSDSWYSDISKWVMQWVRVRIRVRDRVTVKVTVTVRVSCAFSEAFVGIAAVGIGTCTPCTALQDWCWLIGKMAYLCGLTYFDGFQRKRYVV